MPRKHLVMQSRSKRITRIALCLGLLVSAPVATHAEQFVTFCDFHVRGYFDPIVAPGDPAGSPHLHTFTGATGIEESSTPESLLGTGTTCDIDGDWTSYWAPTVFQDDIAVLPGSSDVMRGMRVYYAYASSSPTVGMARASTRQTTRVTWRTRPPATAPAPTPSPSSP